MTLDQVEARVDLGRLIELAKLTEKELSVLQKRNGLANETMTLDEIATERGLSRERIRQIEARAFRKLRETAARQRLMRWTDDIRPLRDKPSTPHAPPPICAPGNITLDCDGCGWAKYMTNIPHSGGSVNPQRIFEIRKWARQAGWLCADGKDFCPHCEASDEKQAA